ncbi:MULTISPECIES: hypothetical protein [Virgibacillus]|uniref:hypothetical protein n=1 Tax=Virgibacillus TaxID=84406 RepID=UPI00047ED76B|nr:MULTISPECIES: hypothetical protein [Virgibacillus]MDY7046176.1 hypothetical protein [Virgibacillus sp. M23]WBX81111.1 hypothetical protein PD280_04885 [Virgibacillus salarius]
MAIFTQLFFPFFVFNKYTRLFKLTWLNPVSSKYYCFYGSSSFGAIMIVLDLQFMSDREYSHRFKYIKDKVTNLKYIGIQREEKEI